MSRKTTIILLAAVLIASFSTYTAAGAKELVFSGVSPTAQDYAMAVIWSNILAKKSADTRMTVVDNGTVKGLRKLAKAQVDICPIGAPHYKDATQKTGKFKKDPDALIAAYKKMSVLFAITTSAAQYIAQVESGVKTIPDFKGKKLAIGRPGGNAGRVTTALFKVHGIDIKAGDADGQYLKYGPAIEQMANGTMDATIVWGGIPHAAVDNASRQMKLRFVSPDPAKLDTFRKNITNGDYYVFQKVPADTIKKAYSGRVEAAGPAYFWTFPFMMAVNNSMPEETAYEITKAFWENIKTINDTSPALSLISLETALDSLSAPIHPGAEKYYKEKGILK